MANWDAKLAGLSASEAQAYLDRLVAEGPARIEELRAEAPVELDLTPESLLPLWEWALGRFRPVGGDDDGELPFWADGLDWDGQRLDAGSLRLVDRIAHYLAAVYLANVPGARWALETDARLASFRQPMLEPGGLEPHVVTLSTAETTVFAPEFGEVNRDPDRLLFRYRRWAERG